ncbi:MAG: 50S ribosomal protein L6 [Planctomycetota bacterium]|nr:MAG: 50S ribosomal protein L6 [Planctomycetota bacterium]
MSRIGKKKIEIPSGVTFNVGANAVNVKGPKGELEQIFLPKVKISVEDDNLISVEQIEGQDNSSAFQGLYRSLISNMIIGVTDGYVKELDVIGVGYKVQTSGEKLTLNIGFNKPVEFKIPKDVKVECPSVTSIKISGINKQRVGQISAEIRSIRKPEPYKGKGIRYKDEVVRRKAGKAVGGK